MLTKIVIGEFKIGEIKRKNLKSQSRGRNASTNWLFQNDCREGKKNQKTERERERECTIKFLKTIFQNNKFQLKINQRLKRCALSSSQNKVLPTTPKEDIFFTAIYI